MGQSGSVQHTGQRSQRHGSRKISLAAMGRRRSSRSKNLSHTFTFIDGVLKVQQLNLNTATEEELMTLPGITRVIAANIVNHRQMIGRFNRVEDLALVSGVGAHKLETIRPEIYVSSMCSSTASSRASVSLDSFGNGTTLVDVNCASVFALQAVPGINQELAANIVEKRQRRGPYRTLNELEKVRGMGKHRLAMIKPYLRIDVDTDGSVTPTPANCTSSSSSPPWNFPQASSTPVANGIEKPPRQAVRTNGISKPCDSSRSNGYTKGIELNSDISEEEIWELLSIASPRPLSPSVFRGRFKGKASIRVASWNLEDFNADKVANPGVREVICRTILENRLSLLALQEVESAEALEKLTQELNVPNLRRVRDWRDNRRVWRSLHLGAGLAILWDSDSRLGIALREQPPETTVLLPVVASAVFRINTFDVTIINVRVHNVDDRKILENFCDGEHAILLGDFSSLEDGKDFQFAINEGSTSFRPDAVFYNDNILWGKGSEELMGTSVTGVVRQGLTHLGIPQGWRWGGPASTHCPVWCQIFTESKNS